MDRSATIVITVSIFLIMGVFLTGCSDSPDSGSTSETVAATTTAGPLFTAGDIVRSATGSESPAWLVVSYDSGSDSYTRALIYRNTDGSYGYRVNSRTESTNRAMMEKVYTVKITHVAVASVPTAAPTTVTTVQTTSAARTTTTTAASATTTTSTARPAIKEMDPDEGYAGGSVSTEISGSNFVSNLTATLRRSGEDSITATTVKFYSSSSVKCTFDIPNSTKVGSWDIVVTNPNGLSGEFTNYFTIRGNKTPD